MDKKFLEEYQHKEDEQLRKLSQRMLDGKFKSDDVYPPDERFPKLKYPVVNAFTWQRDPTMPDIILCQVPFSGSLLIDLLPVPEKDFREYHGFRVKDIGKIVEYSKDTGKIQFVLQYNPTLYEGLNHLDPIFEELEPPLGASLSPRTLLSEDLLRRYEMEYEELAKKRFRPYRLRRWLGDYNVLAFQGKEIMKQYFENERKTYLLLRALNRNEVADQILNALLQDPELAYNLLASYNKLVGVPFWDLRRSSYNYDWEEFTYLYRHLDEKDREPLPAIKFPCDVGAFLMKKMTPYPGSFRAMEAVIDYYEQADLYKTMEALDKGIRDRSPDLVGLKSNELSEILDDLWKDAQEIKRKCRRVDFGIYLTLGVIGPVVGFMASGVIGLLTSLGLAVTTRGLNFFGSAGERIVKKLRPSYLVTVHDFQRKHSLK